MNMKRPISLLMAIMLVVTALSGLAITVSAEEFYEATDAYVLNYTGEDIEGYGDYSAKRLYASDHYAGMYIDEDGDGVLNNWNWTCCSVLNMINTRKLADGGEGAYATIPVYCVDAVTSGVPGYNYRRINLEDSGYYTDVTAGQLRAIFLNSFPYVTDMEKLAADVNAWIAESGADYDQVVNLQESEAITATQVAIWDLANEDEGAQVYAPYLGTGSYYESSEMVPANLHIFEQGQTENTKNNMHALFAYLMDLDPVTSQDAVISDAAFGDTTVSYTKAEDGTYTANVNTIVTATVDDGDDLALTAVIAGKISATETIKNGTNPYTLIIEGLETAADTINLNIDGEQDASDVFLFDPVNGRAASQTMMGYDSSALPVHAEATVAPRILELNKIGNVKTSTTDAEGNVTETTEQVPLQNIQFEIFFVCTMEDYIAGNVTFANAPEISETERAKYVTEDNRIATVTTDENGFASYNFTLNGNPDGIYIVRELHNEYTEAPMDPFYLAVPYTDSDGNVSTTITVNPKNNVENEEIEIEKDVADIDNEHDTYDIGQNHTWIIQSSIPEGMGDGLKYEITDTLDYRLTLVSVDHVAVAKDSGDFGSADSESYQSDESETPAFAETVVLEAEIDYVVTIGTITDDAGNTVDQFAVSLTPAGMAKVADAVDNDGDDTLDCDDYEVRVYFTAYINTNAELGVAIPNQAFVDYTNNLGMDFDAKSDIPDVQTGGVGISKVDTAGNVLAGAQFSIVRPAAEGETADTTITVDDQEIAVVYVDFYATADKSGDKVYEVTTGDDGAALFYGLAYSEKVGTYYIIETEAPAGYNELLSPVAVEVTAASHNDGNEYKIVNTKGFELPFTGGEGTTIFMVVGVVIIGAAMMLIIVPKKKNA